MQDQIYRFFRAWIRALAYLVVLYPQGLWAEEKNHEDPTKVITRLGAGYNGQFTLSGSLAIDATRKLNAQINDDASNWRIGGSWLFRLGIVNFNFSQTDYEQGAYKKNYSIGTFMPLNVLGIEPGGWQIFPMAGLSYNEGETLVENQDPFLDKDFVLMPGSVKGGYIGAFTLNPLSQKWTVMAFVGFSRGSDDYSGAWGGAGVAYTLDSRQSLNLYAFASDDEFGHQEKLGISYAYEFK